MRETGWGEVEGWNKKGGGVYINQHPLAEGL